MPESKECVFCGPKDAPLTKEHVYSTNWQSSFPGTLHNDVVNRVGRSGFSSHHGEPNRFENVVRDVCRSCNAGWMRLLDEAANPIILGMGLGTVHAMSGEEANLFRAWATKTALVRTLQDRQEAQQARAERFHEFYDSRTAFGPLVIQAAACDPIQLDGNSSWVLEGGGPRRPMS